ncbi:flagellar filament capping protein FliD [Pseudoduganella eburnea]|uniref:Flagellar hook-associated protein 2 n=1 Tax=Massilia eburnea TaxID=1776165 RepID=A0A6L6QMA3_9BURK|nr:flagellar filament capping protein FliD [Massilia eburnea]MTW12723.1 flagellar filament capping protein FliD [Massilia eburnea]
MATSVPTYDPKTTAQQLAQIYTQGRQSMIDAQTASANAIDKALNTLSLAMGTFRSSLSAMSSTGSVVSNKATFSSDVGTATANATAVAGNYQFYVEQLATAGQVSYSGITNSSVTGAAAGSLAVKLADGSSFTVSLANGDKDANNVLTAQEIAAAINMEATNNSRVTASTLTVNGQTRLVLTSNLTGQNNSVAGIDTTSLGDANLQSQLGDPNMVATAGTDAVVWVGAQNSAPANKITQASNTFNVVDGVAMTFTKAQAAGAPPVTLNVARDSGGTASNVQNFVDQWNKMMGTLADLTAAGDAAKGKDSGIYASDAGIASLKSRMQSLLRSTVGGASLVTYGITAQRDGTLALDKTRMDKALATNPTGLDAILGKVSLTSPSGVLGNLDALINSWTKVGTGQLASRKDANAHLQTELTARQAALQTQYDNAYNRYLAQFTQLQSLQSQMSGTTSMFEAMFSKSDS